MPETHTVKLTHQAQEQLREIVRYIRYELQAPDTAMHMLDTLEREIASLAQFPKRVPLTEEEPGAVRGYINSRSKTIRFTSGWTRLPKWFRLPP